MRVHAAIAALVLVVPAAAPAAALTDCGALCGRGESLPEPGARVHVVSTFALHAVLEPRRPRVGVLYRTGDGNVYYQAESGRPAATVRAIEIRFLRAAGFNEQQARQYTDLTFLPAIPRVFAAMAVARRIGLTLTRCAP